MLLELCVGGPQLPRDQVQLTGRLRGGGVVGGEPVRAELRTDRERVQRGVFAGRDRLGGIGGLEDTHDRDAARARQTGRHDRGPEAVGLAGCAGAGTVADGRTLPRRTSR
ncbi:hypothetical protein [Amycolatopsis sp. cg9]|uniref:hypothetical protein n=1 Tax=Amycolatopsis sp. cg9 TaxID=3238801 RepID=UPI00352535B9